MYDVIVVGGGASGMTAAICAARRGMHVLLLEKNQKLGRKIAVSGNGKCNLSNADIALKHYHNAYPNELGEILARCNRECVLSFMKSIGICCKEKRGYYYPMSEQAAVVVQMLEAELRHLCVDIALEERVCSVKQTADGYTVTTEKSRFHTEALILACGGMAAPKLGAEETGYRLLKQLGHTVIPLAPALVQMTARERYIKKLQGVRAEVKIRLVLQHNREYEEAGEIIFTENGISGIPVFQLSRYVTQGIAKGMKPQLFVNVLPLTEKETLREELIKRKAYNPSLPLEYLFRSYCNHKLVYALLCELGVDAEAACQSVSHAQLNKLIDCFYGISFEITGTNGFEQAQVTRGGIPLNEIYAATMESKRCPRLYITGELLDVDGICGGYNLHFAWASGMLAGNAVLNDRGKSG